MSEGFLMAVRTEPNSFRMAILRGRIGFEAISADPTATVALSICASEIGLAATLSDGRTGDASGALSVTGARTACACRACSDITGCSGKAAGRGSVTHMSPMPKKTPTVAAPTTPRETR